jgi:hypothetical protein
MEGHTGYLIYEKLFCQIGESILPNTFLNKFRLPQRICFTRRATTEIVLATVETLPNRPYYAKQNNIFLIIAK